MSLRLTVLFTPVDERNALSRHDPGLHNIDFFLEQLSASLEAAPLQITLHNVPVAPPAPAPPEGAREPLEDPTAAQQAAEGEALYTLRPADWMEWAEPPVIDRARLEARRRDLRETERARQRAHDAATRRALNGPPRGRR